MTCPTHATDCPGHYHYEAGLPADLALSWVGPTETRNVRTYTHHHVPPLDHPGWARLLDAINEEPREVSTYKVEHRIPTTPESVDEAIERHDQERWLVDEMPTAAGLGAIIKRKLDAATNAALNVAMIEAGGGRPQHFGVDFPAGPSWADGEETGLVSPVQWHDWEQEVRDVVARHEWDTPAVATVPELTPPPPASGHASWFQPIAWPGYARDEMIERLNLRWKYGHPPPIPDRARRAGVQHPRGARHGNRHPQRALHQGLR